MKVDIQIPKSLSDVPLKNYQEFLSYMDKDLSNAELERIMVEKVMGIPREVVDKMTLDSYSLIVLKLNQLFSSKKGLVRRFTYNGVEYGLIPDLHDMTMGEIMDADSYQEWKDAHKLMAILYRPIKQKLKGKYTIDDYDGTTQGKGLERANMFLELGVDIPLGAKVFFWSIESRLLSYIQRYSQKEVQRLKASMIADSARSGAGTPFSMDLSEVDLVRLNRLSRPITVLPSYFSRLRPTRTTKRS